MGINATEAVNGTQRPTGTNKNTGVGTNATNNIKMVNKPTKDEFGNEKVAKPHNLKTITHTISSGDSIMTIAMKYGITKEELIAQLKDRKDLPADYNVNEHHDTDPKCMREGKTMKISVPKENDYESRTAYKKWMNYETKHYKQCVQTHSKLLASVDIDKPSYESMA